MGADDQEAAGRQRAWSTGAEVQITELDSAKLSYDIGLQFFRDCEAGELEIFVGILERPVIEEILTHLELDPQSPPKRQAREAGHDFAA